MISVNSLCQYLNELTSHSEKKVESLESFFVEGEFSAPVEKLIKDISLLSECDAYNSYFHLLLDGERVALSDFSEHVEKDPYIAQFKFTLDKKSLVQSLYSGGGDVDEILFTSLSAFSGDSNGLGLTDPLIEGVINKQTNTRIHVYGLSAAFGGSKLAIVPVDSESHDNSWLSGSTLPGTDSLLKQIHLVTSEKIVINPRKFELTWGQIDNKEAKPFKQAYAQHLLVSLCSYFYSVDKVQLKGIKHIDTSIRINEHISLELKWLEALSECVIWCYSAEVPEVPLQLLIDRLSLEYSNGSLFNLTSETLSHALEQAKSNYRFVIAKRSDDYRKELKEIYSDIQIVTDKFADKALVLASELLKTFLAIGFIFTIGTVSKAIVSQQLLHSHEGLLLFKAISVYLVASFFIRWLNASADLKISDKALKSWSSKLHSHIPTKEVNQIINDQTCWSKAFYLCSLAFVAAVQLSVATAAFYAEVTLRWLGL